MLSKMELRVFFEWLKKKYTEDKGKPYSPFYNDIIDGSHEQIDINIYHVECEDEDLTITGSVFDFGFDNSLKSSLILIELEQDEVGDITESLPVLINIETIKRIEISLPYDEE